MTVGRHRQGRHAMLTRLLKLVILVPLALVTLTKLSRMMRRAAKKLLDLGSPRIDWLQIAGGLGFADAGYFSRFFQRQAGCAPSAWRQPRLRPLAAQGAASSSTSTEPTRRSCMRPSAWRSGVVAIWTRIPMSAPAPPMRL